MDVLFFFKERTQFIRYFYDTAGMPFYETKHKIENEEAPFDNPPYSEDGEPPYLEQWIEADEALEILGRTCLSMLSPSLELYFRTWEKELGVTWKSGELKSEIKKKGFLQVYRNCFEKMLGISWDRCPADLEIIEQITLARNRDQHPDEITSMRVMHKDYDLKKYPRPFFMSEFDRDLLDNSEIGRGIWMNPTIHVSRDTLYRAIAETEMLSDWLEEYLLKAWYKSRRVID